MQQNDEPLAQFLNRGFEERGLTIDTIAERTKIPRSTIRALCGSMEPAILPQRVYLRGQVETVARELRLSLDRARYLFDRENPVEPRIETEEPPRFNRAAIALGAGLGSIGIIAVILAFIR
jgi:cytoskeletal protein RodZ